MTPEDRQLIETVYTTLTRAEAYGFEASTVALRKMLKVTAAGIEARERASDLGEANSHHAAATD